MAGTAPTLDSLERRLRKIMCADTTFVRRYQHPNHCGEAAWEEGSKSLWISLDPFWHGELATLLHELTHFALRMDRTWGELEEPMILGLEDALGHRIRASKSRAAWWRRALQAKLTKEGR